MPLMLNMRAIAKGDVKIPPPLRKHRSGCLHHDRWNNFSPPTGIAAPLCPFNSGLKAGVSPCSTIALCPPVPPCVPRCRIESYRRSQWCTHPVPEIGVSPPRLRRSQWCTHPVLEIGVSPPRLTGGASGVLILSCKLVCPRHVSFRAFSVFRG